MSLHVPIHNSWDPFSVDRPPFQATEIDIAILRAVARYQFLNAYQLATLIGSTNRVLARLRVLINYQFLNSPTMQLDRAPSIRSIKRGSIRFGITEAGAQLLARNDPPISEKFDSKVNTSYSPQMIRHTTKIASAMIAFERACRSDNAYRLIDHHDLLPYLPEKTLKDEAPLTARVPVTIGRLFHTMHVVPDRLFCLGVKNDTCLGFALEVDFDTTDFRAKFAAYQRMSQAEIHTRRWGFKAFRVLIVTASEAHLHQLIALQKQVIGEPGSNLFLFTTFTQIHKQSPLTDSIWISGKGRAISLFPNSQNLKSISLIHTYN